MAHLHRPDEAVAACDDVVRRFGDAQEAVLSRPVTMAHKTAGYALEIAAYDTEGEEREHVLAEAGRRYGEVEARDPGGAFYNRACVAALRRDADQCRSLLERSADAEKLPTQRHMRRDPDLESVRDTEWFHELVAQAPEKAS